MSRMGTAVGAPKARSTEDPHSVGEAEDSPCRPGRLAQLPQLNPIQGHVSLFQTSIHANVRTPLRENPISIQEIRQTLTGSWEGA